MICNNAGVGGGGPVCEPVDLGRWDFLFEINFFGVLRGVNAFLPRMVEQGEGHIVNTGSRGGLLPLPNLGASLTPRPPSLASIPQLPGIDENSFHTTRTVDFDYVMEGEIVMVLDEDRVELRKGDCVIQQGTRHAWHNESDKLAILVALIHRPDGI